MYHTYPIRSPIYVLWIVLPKLFELDNVQSKECLFFFFFFFFVVFFFFWGGGGGGGRGGVTLTFLEILYLIQTVQTLMRFSGVWSEYTLFVYIGIKHGFSCINILQVPWEVLKTAAGGRGFQHLPRDLENVNALKKHVRSLLLHKN